MQNKGIEVVLSGVPVSTEDFKWDASFNFTSIKNELTSLGQDTFLLGGNYSPGLTQESPFCLKVGESMGSFWGFEWWESISLQRQLQQLFTDSNRVTTNTSTGIRIIK